MAETTKATTPQARTIALVVHGTNDICVHEGERYSGRLTWDEALGQVATLTQSGSAPRYEMLTPEGWAEREERMRAFHARNRYDPATADPAEQRAIQQAVRQPWFEHLPAAARDEITEAHRAIEEHERSIPF